MTTITVDHISKQFGDDESGRFAALDNIAFRLASGEVLAVVGPSGCGKSTLLRAIGGLVVPDTGTILYDNVPLAEIPIRERGIGMVFQEGGLVPHWESGRSVGFFLWLRRREHEVPARVARIAQITGVGLDHLLGRFPSELSGGERQRVTIARALARDPRVFLFDEPFSHIDAKLRGVARVELKRLLTEFPVTSVYVTHDQTEAIALGSRIAVMRAGRLEQMGTYAHLYDKPVNWFVASFIGTPTINRFEGQVRDHHWYGGTFGGYPIRTDLPDNARVWLGVRPEYLHLSSAEAGSAAVVETVTPYYAERHSVIEVQAGRDRFALYAPLDAGVHAGETIHVRLDPAGILYFDPYTEGRIG